MRLEFCTSFWASNEVDKLPSVGRNQMAWLGSQILEPPGSWCEILCSWIYARFDDGSRFGMLKGTILRGLPGSEHHIRKHNEFSMGMSGEGLQFAYLCEIGSTRLCY